LFNGCGGDIVINDKTERIIDAYIEQNVVGIPNQKEHEKVRHTIIREAIIFALKVHGKEFTTCLGGWEDEA